MGNLRKHAESELALMGYDENCEQYDKIIRDSVLQLIDTFSTQGHSGFSAPHCIKMFEKLANYEILSPIQCTDDEWVNTDTNLSDKELYQNNRLSSVFKVGKNGIPYYLDAIVWMEEDGCSFTGIVEGIKSRQFIKIPFTPKTFFIDITKDRIIKDRNKLAEAIEYYYRVNTRNVIVEKEEK